MCVCVCVGLWEYLMHILYVCAGVSLGHNFEDETVCWRREGLIASLAEFIHSPVEEVSGLLVQVFGGGLN